jgi:protein-tyrosine-phosphatase
LPEETNVTERATVLFACVHNSGRSVAAATLARHYAGDALHVRDAGSDPSSDVNATVAKALADVGLPVTDHTPTRLNHNLVNEADVVVTLGCNEACPAVPGKRIIDWPVADPKGQDERRVRQILADLDARVRELVTELAPDTQLPSAIYR